MNTPLWAPAAPRVAAAQVTRFSRFVEGRHAGLALPDYSALYRWSIDRPEDFWQDVWDFCEIIASRPPQCTLRVGERMTSTRWFPGARLNFAENLLRRRDDAVALVSLLESGQRRELTYAQLHDRVARLANALRERGVEPGDRVAGFLPNVPEAVIAMLACTALGATWTSCSPDFGLQGVTDRFSQVEPRVLFACDGYFYNGKGHDSLAQMAALADAVGSIEQIVIVPLLCDEPDLEALHGAQLFDDFLADCSALEFTQLPFDHPLYILYSSGTTGLPKCIIHGAGGTLLQHLKEHQLACDIGSDDVFFYFTTCGWMMWNWLVTGLASGATLILYDGSPLYEQGRRLLRAIDEEGITVFGTSAKFIAALEKAGRRPREEFDLASLRTVLSTGSPLAHESFDYLYREVKTDICVSSIAGGTDIISCFVGGSPVLPVYRGEIQCRGLGMAVEFLDQDGSPLARGSGELVCTRPFPSMPVGFWHDPQGHRYQRAYFERFDDVWCQGDYGELTEHDGIIIHGRSDAVLNPGGVRIGTAEIYRQVEKLDAILESVVIGQQWDGDVRIVLFVVLRPDTPLNAELESRIRSTIRINTTPRHVPAKIIAVADIPRTRSGKIAELAVRNAVHGNSVRNEQTLANPEALTLYCNLRELAS